MALISIQDTLWSAQEDRQLIGRLWRNGQDKIVIVYRVIALGTTDVLLNNIAFDKEAIMDAFTTASGALSMSMPRLEVLMSDG
jgi:SNF2 family DNA or RNA helicase